MSDGFLEVSREGILRFRGVEWYPLADASIYAKIAVLRLSP
jgi:hypothetical protein